MACSCTMIFAIILASIAAIKLYLKLTIGWCKSHTCLVGKTAIITGTNTGIGYETALELAKRGARVILACRNEEKANHARDQIIKATGNENVIVKLIDMSSLESVRAFAKDINSTESQLNILINNAGAGGLPNLLTKDGLQLMMQVNYFSSVLLTNLLLPLLKKSSPTRIINVASIGSKFGKLDTNNLNYFPGHLAIYSNTKLCNVLFTIELAKKLKGTGITTYSLHPGVVSTDIFRRMIGFQKYLVKFISIFFKNCEEGAQTSIYLATAQGIEKHNGKYFQDCSAKPFYESVIVTGLSKKIWDKTEEMLKLRPEDWEI